MLGVNVNVWLGVKDGVELDVEVGVNARVGVKDGVGLGTNVVTRS